jgi:hypothetical protein
MFVGGSGDHVSVVGTRQKKNPKNLMFVLEADTTSVSCPTRPWIEKWRRAMGFSFGDFVMEFYAVPKSDMPWDAFMDCLRAKSPWHKRNVCRYAEDPVPDPDPAYTCPAKVLWRSCSFGNGKRWWGRLKPETTCEDVVAMVPALWGPKGMKDDDTFREQIAQDYYLLAKAIAKYAVDGKLATACIPGAFDHITQWLYVYEDAMSAFEVSFGTDTMWYWVHSSSS